MQVVGYAAGALASAEESELEAPICKELILDQTLDVYWLLLSAGRSAGSWFNHLGRLTLFLKASEPHVMSSDPRLLFRLMQGMPLPLSSTNILRVLSRCAWVQHYNTCICLWDSLASASDILCSQLVSR